MDSPDELFRLFSDRTKIPFVVQPLRVEASARRYYRLKFFGSTSAAEFLAKSNAFQTAVTPADSAPDESLSEVQLKSEKTGNVSISKIPSQSQKPGGADQNTSLLLCLNASEESFIQSDFYLIGNYLRERNFPVPAVFGYSDEMHFFTGEFAGMNDVSLYLERFPEHTEKMVRRSLDILSELHGISPPEPVKSRYFDRDKFDFEKNFLMNALLKISDDEKSKTLSSRTAQEYDRLTEKLLSGDDFVFTHRDFHTRNIMMKEMDSDAKMSVIDFQDARMGRRAYDLASFLFDPYAEFSPEVIQKGFSYYREISQYSMTEEIFYLQALQRIMKALGSYLFLVNEKKLKSYSPSVLSACRILLFIIGELHLKGPVEDFVLFIRDEIYPKIINI